ncbi:MAG: hypothetical protein KHX68_01625 [Roseburia sp.]|nr:hypothetical protein [Roseburia sp.]
MNTDQTINHMMKIICTTAELEGIQVARHFSPQEIVDSTLAACHSIIDGKRLSEKETAVLTVTFGDTWRNYIQRAGNVLMSAHFEVIRKRGM